MIAWCGEFFSVALVQHFRNPIGPGTSLGRHALVRCTGGTFICYHSRCFRIYRRRSGHSLRGKPHILQQPPRQLSEAEAALLAAVLPNPKQLQVDQPSAYVRQPQRWVMQQAERLRQYGWLARVEQNSTMKRMASAHNADAGKTTPFM